MRIYDFATCLSELSRKRWWFLQFSVAEKLQTCCGSTVSITAARDPIMHKTRTRRDYMPILRTSWAIIPSQEVAPNSNIRVGKLEM